MFHQLLLPLPDNRGNFRSSVELKLSNCLIYLSGEIGNAQVGVAVHFCI